MNGLIKYEAARQALATIHRVDEVKDIRDKAQALAHYHRQAKNIEMERQCIEIRIRAEKRAGEILKEMGESGERVVRGDNLKVGPNSKRGDLGKKSLKDLGITPDQSSHWQRLAALPEEEFEEVAKGRKPKNRKDTKKAAQVEISRDINAFVAALEENIVRCEELFEGYSIEYLVARLCERPEAEKLTSRVEVVAQWLLKLNLYIKDQKNA